MAKALEPVSFADLAGLVDDDALAAFRVFLRSAKALVTGAAPARPARTASRALLAAAAEALSAGIADGRAARRFFERLFRPFHVRADSADGRGFLTGYYEPRVAGSLTPAPGFTAPVLARPDDLVTFAPGETPAGFDPALSAARRLDGGRLQPFPERAEIEAAEGERQPILWLRDHVELFMAQVQGSACVELADGGCVRLAYDGRNGQPYTSIGRLLIDAGEIAPAEMSLDRLKDWLRGHGQQPGGEGRSLMQGNRSYVFFKLERKLDPADGPTGGEGVALAPLRSIAIDRALWSYGTPFWLDAELPWRGREPSAFRRLTIAQDTGSAIVGPARADLFFGGGDEAGRRAGGLRHPCRFVALLPVGEAP